MFECERHGRNRTSTSRMLMSFSRSPCVPKQVLPVSQLGASSLCYGYSLRWDSVCVLPLNRRLLVSLNDTLGIYFNNRPVNRSLLGKAVGEEVNGTLVLLITYPLEHILAPPIFSLVLLLSSDRFYMRLNFRSDISQFLVVVVRNQLPSICFRCSQNVTCGSYLFNASLFLFVCHDVCVSTRFFLRLSLSDCISQTQRLACQRLTGCLQSCRRLRLQSALYIRRPRLISYRHQRSF